MSTALRATPRPISQAPSQAPKSLPRIKAVPQLEAVAAPRHARSIAPFAWSVVLIVVLAFASVLVLNTTMAEGAYDIRELKIEIRDLHQERAAALTQLEENAAPYALAAQAQALGMVPAQRVGAVSLADALVVAAGQNP